VIRVVIADDHHLVREGIRALLEKGEDIDVVGEAESGIAALELVRRLEPDVLVTDISMPGLTGLEALEQLKAMAIRTQVVILTMYSSEVMVRQALKYGARGYLLKDSLSVELLAAVRAAGRGATYLSPAVSDTLLVDLREEGSSLADAGGIASLTPREKEVLQRICSGATNQAIANEMGISVKTVERHRANLMSKLGVNNLVGLVRKAIRHGLVSLDV